MPSHVPFPWADPPGAAPTVHLLGGPFVALGGERREVPDGSKRLLVFLALGSRAVDRRYAAGSLWPDVADSRAAGNLRSALWRLRAAGIDIVTGDKTTLALSPATTVDVDVLSDWAGQVLDVTVPTIRLGRLEWRTDALDLLPGWYDDWVLVERERLRQLLLHALEFLALRLSGCGRFVEAIECALIALRAEPLRESAHRTLMQVHVAEGNLVEARRVYDKFACLLRRELGVAPSPGTTEILRRRNRDLVGAAG